MKYTKNKFKIDLPSLEVEKRNEKRKQLGILKMPTIVKLMDSEKRRHLRDKIDVFKQIK